jgi:hypothetical protein
MCTLYVLYVRVDAYILDLCQLFLPHAYVCGCVAAYHSLLCFRMCVLPACWRECVTIGALSVTYLYVYLLFSFTYQCSHSLLCAAAAAAPLSLSTFWYIQALHEVGRETEARTLFEEMLGLCNHVGIMSEDSDPKTNEPWGNFPQTYSMCGIINCALLLSKKWTDVC